METLLSVLIFYGFFFFLITPLISKCRFVAKYTRVYLNKIQSNKIVIVIRV